MKCLLQTIFLITIRCTNAQIIPSIFNNLFAGLAIGVVNNIADNILQTLDPFDFNLQSVVVINPPQECAGVAQMQVITNSFSGISSAGLSQLEMLCFQLLPLKFGFRLKAIAPFVETSFTGKIVTQNPNCTESIFSGEGESRNAIFDFSFEAELSILPNLIVRRVTIGDFLLELPSVDTNLSDLGPYDSIRENIEEEIKQIVDDVIEKRFNSTVLQNAVDSKLPFSLF